MNKAVAYGLLACPVLWLVGACSWGLDSVARAPHGPSLVAEPNVVVADGQASVSLRATVRDVAGNPLPGRQVLLSCEDANLRLVQPAATDAAGVARGSASCVLPGAFAVRASFVDAGERLNLGAPVTVRCLAPDDAGGGPPATAPPVLSLAVSSNRAVANGRPATQVTLTATGGANKLAGSAVRLQAGSARDALSSAAGVLDANGQFVTTLSSTLAGARSLSAQVGELTAAADYRFVAGPGDPAHSRLQVESRVAGGDGTDALTVRIGIFDAFDNPVADEVVDVSSLVAGTTFVPPRATSDANGQVVVTVTSTALGAVPIVATLRGPTDANGTSPPGAGSSVPSNGNAVTIGVLNGAATFAVGAPTSANSTLTGPAQTTVADGQSLAPLRLVLRDAADHAVAGVAVTLAPGASMGPAGALRVVAAGGNVTGSDGSLSFAATATAVGALPLVASGPNFTLTASVPFVAGPAAAVASTLQLSAKTVVADGSAAAAVTVHAQDGYGHALAGESVVLTAYPASLQLAPPSGSTDANGNFVAQASGVSAGNVLLLASLGNISLQAPLVLVAGAPSRVSSTLSVTPDHLTADNVATAAVKLLARDARGNAVTQRPVTLLLDAAGTALDASAGTTDATGAFRTTLRGTLAQAANVVAPLADGNLTAAFTLQAGSPNTARTTLLASPNAGVVADGNAHSALALRVRDAFGNPVAGQTATLAVDLTGTQLSAASGTTDLDGFLRTFLTSTHAGYATVSAAAGGASAATQVAFVAGAAAASASSVAVTPNQTVADGAAELLVQIVARDATGNPAGNVAVALTGDGPDATFAPATGSTDANGAFSARWRATRAGPRTGQVAIADASGAPAAQLQAGATFVPGPIYVAASPVTVVPGTLTAGGSPAYFTVQLRDAFGNAVAGAALGLSVDGGNVSLSQASAVTDANGRFAGTVVATGAGAKQLVVTASGTSLSASFGVVPGSADASTSALLASPASVVADGNAAAAVTLSLRDAYGNAVGGANVTFAAAPPAATVFSQVNAATDANGHASASVQSVLAGARVVSAQAANLTFQAPLTFVAGPVDAATSTLSAEPNVAVADGVSSVTVAFVARDAQGNLAPNQGVTLSSNGLGDALTPPGPGQTGADGSYQATLVSQGAGSKVVSAASGNAVVQVQVAFVAGTADTAHTSFDATPDVGTVADGNQAVVLTLLAADAYNNPAAGQNFTLSCTSATARLGAAGPVADGAALALDGAGAWTGQLVDTAAGTDTCTANLGGTSVSVTAGYVAGPPDAGHSQFFASPDQLPADGTALSTAYLQLADAFGNAVGGANVTLVASGSTVALSPNAGAAAADGTFAATLSATSPTLSHVQASSGNLLLATDVNFIVGSASAQATTLTADPPTLAAQAGAVSVLTLRVADASSTPIVGQAANFTVSGGNAKLSASSGVTDANGQVVLDLRATLVGTATVRAVVDGVTTVRQVTVVPGSPNVATSALAAAPNALVADGNAATTLTAQARDGFGNPVPALALRFAASGSGAFIASPNAVTDAQGVAQASLSAVVAETKQVTASSGNFVLTGNVTFRAGAPSAQVSMLVASPNQAVADGNASLTLTLAARDAYGNAVANAAVLATASGGNVAFGALPSGATASGTTDVSGGYAVAVRAVAAGPRQLTTTVAGVPIAAPATFVAGPPDANQSSLTTAPAQAVADGNATLAGTLRLADARNNAVGGANVTFALSGSGGALDVTNGSSDANGQLAVRASATVAEIKQLTAAASAGGGNVTLSAPLRFVAGAPASATSSWVSDAVHVVADGNQQAHLTLVARDVRGNLVPGASVALQADGAGASFTPAAFGTTDANGTLLANASATVAGAQNLTVTVGPATLRLAQTFVAGPPSAANSSLGGAPASVVADGASNLTLTALLRDARNNLAGGQNVTFASSQPGDAFFLSNGTPVAPPIRVTDASGSASLSLRGTVAGVRTVTASFAGGSLSANFTLQPGAPDSATSLLAVSPNVVVADGNQAATLTLVVRDTYSNLIANRPVVLSLTGTSNVLDGNSGNTDASGSFVTGLRSTKAEVKSITAALGGASVGASVTFVAGAPTSGQSTFVASPNQVVADGSSGSTLLANFRDAFGNACPALSVRFAASGNAYAVSPLDANTDASGQASSLLTSTLAGTRNASATASYGGNANLVLSAPVSYIPGAPSGSTSTFTVSPNNVVADGTSVAAVVLVVRDAYNNPVPAQPVALTASGNDVSYAAANGNTATDGSYATTLVTTEAGLHVLAANIGGTSLNANARFVAGPPSSANSTLTPSPSQVVADGNAAITLTVRVRDAHANPVINRALTLSVGGSNNALGQSGGNTDATGSFVTTLKSTKAQQKAVTANLGGASVSGNVTFVPGSPTAQTIYFTADANAQAVVANGSQAATLTLLVQDPTANPIANQNVTFTVSSGGNVAFSPNVGTTDANGVLTTLARSTLAEAKVVRASVAGIDVTQGIRFVAGPPVAAKSLLLASPNQAVANGNSTVVLALSLADAFANPVPSAPVTFSSTGSATVSNADTATSTGGTAGASLRSKVAQNVNATVSFAGGSLTAPVTFVAGPVANANSSLQVSPNVVVANGTSVATLTVALADAFANPIQNQNVTLDDGAADDVFGSKTLTTGATGNAATTVASVRAGGRTVVAQAQNTSLSGLLTFVAGPASAAASSLYANPNVVVADGNSGTTFTLLLRDAYANPIANANVAFSADDANVVFLPPSGLTDSAGNLQAQVRSVVAGARIVSASVNGTAISGNVTFVPGAPSAAQSSWTVSPSSLTADGNALCTLQLTLRDAQRNVIGQQNVSVSTSGSNNFLGGSPGSATAGVTDAAGRFSTTLASTKAEQKTVSVSAQAASLNAQVTFVPGAATNQTVSLSASPNVVVANNVNTLLLTLRATDALANPIPGQPVHFGGTGAAVSFGSPNALTDAAGQANSTLRGTQAGTFLAVGTVQNIDAQAQVTLVNGPADANASTLSLAPNSATADGNSAVVVSLTVRDSFGNAVGGQSVSFAATGGNNALSPNTGVTDASGVATTALRTTLAESKTVSATFAGQQRTGVATFVPGSISNAKSSFLASGPTTVADGNAAAVLQFVGSDAQGNPTPSRALALSVTAGSASLGATNLMTDGNGRAQTTLRATVADTKTVVLSVDGTSFSVPVTFVAGSPNAARSSLAASPNVASVGGNVALVATVADAFGNLVSGQNVSFASSVGSDTFAPTASTTNGGGSTGSVLRGTSATARTVTATAGSASFSTNVTLVAGSPQRLTLAVSPNTAVNDGTASVALSAVAYDTYNNLVPAASVGFAASGSNNVFGPATATADANGLATSALRSTRAQQQVVTASAGAGQANVTVYFTASTASAAQSTLSFVPPTGTPADRVSNAVATATMRGADGSLVVNRPVTFSSAFGELAFAGAPVLTDGNGQAQLNVASSLFGSKKVLASVGGVAVGGTVGFGGLSGKPIAAWMLPTLPGMSMGADTASLSVAVADLNHDAWPDVVVSADTGALLSFINQGNGLFGSPVRTPASTSTRAIVAADFTQDGNVDLVSAAYNDFAIMLHRGLGNGGFASPGTPLVTASAACAGVGTADLNGDGVPDLVASCQDGVGIRTFLGTGGGTLASVGNYVVQGVPRSLAIGDVDFDGHLDIVSANVISPNFQVLYGDGNGNFAAPRDVPCGVNNSGLLAVTDLNGDGLADVVLSGWASGARVVYVVMSGPGRTFAPAVLYNMGVTPSGVAVLDVDQDGNKDLVVASAGSGGASVLLSGGNGTFVPASLTAVASNHVPWNVATADFDLDGRSDLLTGTNGSSPFVSVTLANGRWLGPAAVTMGVAPRALAVGDLNKDGFADVVSCDYGTNTASVALNQNGNLVYATGYALLGAPKGAPAIGDVNGDGLPDVLVANATGSNVSLLLGTGGGALAPVVGVPVAASTTAALLTDVNADGNLDLVVSNVSTGARVYLGSGNASFTLASTLTTSTSLAALSVADVDGDGYPDLLAMGGSGLQLWRGTGNANFATLQTVGPATGLVYASPGVGDVNGDGLMDVVVAATNGNVLLYLGTTATTGTLQRQPDLVLATGSSPSAARFVDINGDGRLDVVATVVGNSTVQLFFGNGTASFASPIVYAGAYGATDIAVADFDRDGRMDFVVGADNSNSYTAPPPNGQIFAYTNAGALPAPSGRPLSATSVLAASPLTQTTDGNATISLSLALNDIFGAPVGSQPVTLTAIGENNVFGATSGATAPDGTFVTTLRSTKAQTETIVVQAGLATFPVQVTFVPGAPSATTSTLALTPNAATVGPSNTVNVAIVARDAQGNLSPNKSVTLAGGGANNTFATASGTTDANGAFATTLSSTRAQMQSISATLGASAVVSGNVTFVASSPNATTSTLLASPNPATAGTDVALTATVRDLYGNPVSGQNVTFTSSVGADGLVPASAASNTSGVATTVLRGTSAQVRTVTVAAGAASFNANVIYFAAAPNATYSSLSVNPTSQVANNANTVLLTALVGDAYGNPVAGQSVTFATSNTSGNDTFAATSANTNAAGTATTTLRSNKAEAKTFTATAGSAVETAAATFVAGSPNVMRSSVAAAPSSFTADNVAATTVTVLVKDAYGNPAPGQAVALSSSGINNTFAASNGNTDAAGTYVTTLRTSTAQAKTITAALATGNVTTSVTSVAGSPNATASTFAASPSSFAAGASTSLTATVRDAFGNLVAGQNVTFASDGTANTFTPSVVATNASGQATSVFSSSKAEAKNLTATAGAAVETTSVTVVAASPNATTSALAASPNPAAAGSAISLTATVKDAYGNVVGGQNVTFTSSVGADALVPTLATTNGLGSASSVLTGTSAQARTLTANAGGANFTLGVTYVAASPNATNSSLLLSPSLVYLPGATTVRVTAVDAYSNACPNVTVALAATASPTMASSMVTNASGVAQTTASYTAGSTTLSQVTATFGPVTLQGNVTLALNDTLAFAAGDLPPLPAGLTESFRLTAYNGSGAVDTGYRGTVSFTSSDAQASVPGAYTFTAADAGVHNFAGAVRFRSLGTNTLTATDNTFTNVTATSAGTLTSGPVLAPVNLLPKTSARATCLEPAAQVASANTLLLATSCRSLASQVFSLGSDDTLRVLQSCVTAPSGPLAVGAKPSLQPCTGSVAQRWAPGTGGMASSVDGNFCIDGVTASTGLPATLSACNNANTLALAWPATSDYVGVFRGDGYGVLDVSNSVYSPNTVVQTYHFTSQPSFRWTPAGELRTLQQLCLTPVGGAAAGANVVLATCNGASAQQWSIAGPRIKSLATPTLCLDAGTPTTADGGVTYRGKVTLATCAATTNQNFVFAQGAEFFQLRLTAASGSPNCLASNLSTPTAGSTYLSAACQPQLNQMFIADTLDTGFSYPRFTMTMGDSDADWQAMQLPRDPPQAGDVPATVSMNRGDVDTQRFAVQANITTGSMRVVAGDAQSLCLDTTSAPTSLASCSGAAKQTFSMAPVGGRLQTTQNPNLCLAASNANASYLSPITLQPCQAAELQRFFLPWGAALPQTPAYATDNPFSPMTSAGLCLDVSGTGQALLLRPCTEGLSQVWDVYTFGQNGAGTCLKASSLTAGAGVLGGACGASSLNFTFKPF